MTTVTIEAPAGRIDEGALRDHVLRLGVWIFLATVTMLFAAFSSAYVVRSSSTDWEVMQLPWIVWLNTGVILLSSATLEASRRQARRRIADAGFWLLVTWLLGAAFLVGQIAAWRQLAAAGIGLPTSPHSAFFFILTGIHGLHLAAGLVVLTVAGAWMVLLRRRGDGDSLATAARRSLDLGGLLWHFLAGLWVYLLVMLTLFA